MKDDPLMWQKKQAQVYSLLHGYAVPHFAIQGTSVPSGRAFSMAGDIITKTKTQWCWSKEVGLLVSGVMSVIVYVLLPYFTDDKAHVHKLLLLWCAVGYMGVTWKTLLQNTVTLLCHYCG